MVSVNVLGLNIMAYVLCTILTYTPLPTKASQDRSESCMHFLEFWMNQQLQVRIVTAILI